MARLTIEIDAKDADRAIKLLEKDLVSFEKQIKSSEKATQSFANNTTRLLKGAGAAFAGVFAVREAIDFSKTLGGISDEYSNIRAKINLVTSGADEFNSIYEELHQIGLKTGTTLDVNAQAFTKLASAMEDTERADIARYIDLANKSLAVSGANAGEAASFMTQWGQAMSSGAFYAEELNTMIDTNSYLINKLTKNLGVNIKQLKEMGSSGELTRDMFVKALDEISATIEEDFAKMPLTIEKSVNEITQVFKKMYADADNAAGGSTAVAEAIHNLAMTVEENKEEIGNVLAGIIDSVPSVVSGIENVGSNVVDLFGIVGSINSATGLDIGDWGLIGAILLKGPKGYGGLLSALVVLNSSLESYGMNIGSIPEKYNETANAIQAFFDSVSDVVTGKRDWWTGEFIGDVSKIDDALRDAFGDIDNVDINVGLDASEAINGAKSLGSNISKAIAGAGEKSEKELTKSLEKITKKIQEANDDMTSLSLDLGEDLSSAIREGLSGMDAWDNINEQLDAYKEKAQNAANAGNWKEQEQYLERIKDLLSDMPTEVTETVSAADVERARKIYEYQLRITQGGKNAYGDAAAPFEKAKQNYLELLAAQKEGKRVVVSEQEVIQRKIEETKRANEDILENKRQQIAAMEDEKSNIESSLQGINNAAEANVNLAEKAKEVGDSWNDTGEEWDTVSQGIVDNINEIMDGLDEAIKKMNTLNSNISSGISGARADGGDVVGGRSYLVGERGPEIFTPSSSGFIIPNEKIGSKSGSDNMVKLQLDIGGTNINLSGSEMNIKKLMRLTNDQKRFAS